MEEATAADQLAAAGRYEDVARRNSRWYVRYLVFFGIASFGLGTAMAFKPGHIAVFAIIAIWVIFIGALSWWARTKPVAIRGYKTLHNWAIGGWTAIWVIAEFVGSRWHVWPWWIGCAAAMAALAFTCAWIAHRRTVS